MSWRDDPQIPPYWIEFADLLLAVHSEWEPFILGPLDGHGIYELGDMRFFVEIPSEHPTIREPLTIEVADQVSGVPIDIYWNGYFEHNFKGRSSVADHVARVVQRVEEWTSDRWVFVLWIEPRTEMKVPGAVGYADGERVSTTEMRSIRWSWRGTHDEG